MQATLHDASMHRMQVMQPKYALRLKNYHQNSACYAILVGSAETPTDNDQYV